MYSSKDLEYMSYTLGDIKVIELLILYRYKYDDYMFMEGSAWHSLETVSLSEEVIVTYESLDSLIEKCEFSSLQLNIIRLAEEGYTHQEIGFELGVHSSTIEGRLKTVYGKILEENLRDWRASIYKNTLNLKTKTCSKCKKELPGTPEFYTIREESRDGFRSQCKKCRN